MLDIVRAGADGGDAVRIEVVQPDEGHLHLVTRAQGICVQTRPKSENGWK